MTKDDAVKFLAEKYSDGSITWVDKGQMNFVAIVDSKYVYKFPKNADNFGLLQKEFEIYKILDGKISLNIPRAIELNEQHQYLMLSYVAGKPITSVEVVKLDQRQRMDLAEKLSQLMLEINTQEIKNKFDMITKDEIEIKYYIERWLKAAAEHCRSNTNKYSGRYLELYDKLYDGLEYGFCAGEFLAHKDLHEDNMVFDEQMKLAGVIDFAEMRRVSLYAELRTIYRFGIDVVERIIDLLGELAGEVNADKVELFAAVYEYCIVIHDEYINQDLPWRVEQAKFYLRQWGEAV